MSLAWMSLPEGNANAGVDLPTEESVTGNSCNFRTLARPAGDVAVLARNRYWARQPCGRDGRD